MEHRLETRAVHGGEERQGAYGALTMPVVMSSTYTFGATDEVLAFVERKAAGKAPDRYEYARYGNPTQSVAERKLAELDGGERALLFSSGMAAITTSLLTLLSSGDHLVLVGGVYRRTREFVRQHLARLGIEATESPAEALADVIRPSTRVVLFEVPTNPHLRVPNVEAIVALAGRHGLITAADATFATPVNHRPLELGVDVVFHSATKYIGGHNDLLAGAAIGSAELLNAIERACVLARGDVLDLADFPPRITQAGPSDAAPGEGGESPTLPLAEVERRHIIRALEFHNWTLAQTATSLGIHRNTLRLKMNEYGIKKG